MKKNEGHTHIHEIKQPDVELDAEESTENNMLTRTTSREYV